VSRAAGRAERLDLLRERLEAYPRSVVELAEALGVARRTIERDLRLLGGRLGHALERHDDHRYFIPKPPSDLNEVEVLATFSAVRMLLHMGIGDQHYRSSMTKLASKLPLGPRRLLMREIEPLQPAPEDRVFEFVARAWVGRRVLRCRYDSVHVEGEGRVRHLEIHHVEINRTNLAAYAIARERGGAGEPHPWKVFKLSRMRDVGLTDEQFAVDPAFDPRAHQSGSFGIVPGEAVWVDVRVKPSTARAFLEQRRDAVSEVGWESDGSLLARVRGTRDAYGRAIELLPYLLGWGPGLEVLAPDDVRAAVAQAHRAAAAHYAP
jgi:predicted DNA-binding transcriptional regulator YafY